MGSRNQRDDGYDEGYYTDFDHQRRRHRSVPPKSTRTRSPVKDDTPQRPKYAKDDSYYNPRDKYYLTPGEDASPDYGYFSSPREEPIRQDESRSRHQKHSPPPQRHRSPSLGERRHRHPEHSEHRHRRHSPSPSTRYRSPSPEVRQHRHHSHDRHSQQYHEDDDDRRSRHSRTTASVAGSTRRSMTAAPPVRERRESRRDSRDSHYPPHAGAARPSRPGVHRKRSSTMPSSTSRRPRSASTSSNSPKSPTDWAKAHKDLFMGAARTALETGAVAAVKVRDDPGPWIGMKGTKVVTSALGAALVDTYMESKKPQMKGGMRHSVAKQVATVALGTLVTKPAAHHTRFGRKG